MLKKVLATKSPPGLVHSYVRVATHIYPWHRSVKTGQEAEDSDNLSTRLRQQHSSWTADTGNASPKGIESHGTAKFRSSVACKGTFRFGALV